MRGLYKEDGGQLSAFGVRRSAFGHLSSREKLSKGKIHNQFEKSQKKAVLSKDGRGLGTPEGQLV
jgi:hypothetical protein